MRDLTGEDIARTLLLFDNVPPLRLKIDRIKNLPGFEEAVQYRMRQSPGLTREDAVWTEIAHRAYAVGFFRGFVGAAEQRALFGQEEQP